MSSTYESFLQEFGTLYTLSHIKQSSDLPFHQHHQLPQLLDIMLRQFHHHVCLHIDFSEEWQPWFFESLLWHIAHDATATALHHADLLFVHPSQLSYLAEHQQALLTKIDNYAKPLLIATTQPTNPEQFIRDLQLLINHTRVRFLIIDQQAPFMPKQLFSYLQLNELSEKETTAILKIKRQALEQHHHVLIPDELLTEAYSLAMRYLNPDRALENALLLLDTSAARTNADERIEQHHQFKPVLTSTAILTVLSSWTRIPSTHLHDTQFKLHEFIEEMQSHIFGQDTAINLLAHELLQTPITLQPAHRPLSSFLFAGSAHCGKKSMVRAMTETLFKQTAHLYFTLPLSASTTTLTQVKMQSDVDKKQCYLLTDIIAKTPYAVLVFDNIERASLSLLQQLEEILATGFWRNAEGTHCNFTQATLIFTTTLGTACLLRFSKSDIAPRKEKNMDLMQFLSNEPTEASRSSSLLSPQTLIDAITPELAAHLPTTFYLHIPVIPFLSLNAAAIEKILRIKLIELNQQLHELHGIELHHAPEVIRYLANEVLNRQETIAHVLDINKTLKHLYFCVEQSILHHPENKQSQQLFLQLNETGKLLRCDWLDYTNKKSQKISD